MKQLPIHFLHKEDGHGALVHGMKTSPQIIDLIDFALPLLTVNVCCAQSLHQKYMLRNETVFIPEKK